jgi:hypothetical protein
MAPTPALAPGANVITIHIPINPTAALTGMDMLEVMDARE